jgi:hypothetical protein
LTCLNGTSACTSWGFESNTVEGWSFGRGNLDPNPTAAVTTLHPAVGSRSLFVPVSTIAWVQVPFCAGIGASMAGKRFHAQVYFDTGGVAFDNQMQDLNQVYVTLATDPNIPPFGAQDGVLQAYLDPNPLTGTALFIPNSWQSLDAPMPTDDPLVTTQAAMIQIGINLAAAPATYTRGTLFVDDVRIF